MLSNDKLDLSLVNSIDDTIDTNTTSDSITVISTADSTMSTKSVSSMSSASTTSTLRQAFKGLIGDIIECAAKDGYQEIIKHVFPAVIQSRLGAAVAVLNPATSLQPKGFFFILIIHSPPF
jgi:hypothetical protein